jgi:hypothetical protein
MDFRSTDRGHASILPLLVEIDTTDHELTPAAKIESNRV